MTNSNLIFEPQNLTIDTIKKYLCENATDQELMMGLQIAKTFNLNPLKREIYFIKYKDDKPMSVVTGYEVYLKRADRSGKYAGLKSWTTGSVETNDLVGHVKIYRKDWTEPLELSADYNEYVQLKKDFKTGKVEPNKFWKDKPKTMIKKVAESQGFRKAFPDEFDGMPYTSDEIVDQEKIVDITDVKEMPVTSTRIDHIESNLEVKPVVSQEQAEDIKKLAIEKKISAKDLNEFLLYNFNVKSRKDVLASQYQEVINQLKAYNAKI